MTESSSYEKHSSVGDSVGSDGVHLHWVCGYLFKVYEAVVPPGHRANVWLEDAGGKVPLGVSEWAWFRVLQSRRD